MQQQKYLSHKNCKCIFKQKKNLCETKFTKTKNLLITSVERKKKITIKKRKKKSKNTQHYSGSHICFIAATHDFFFKKTYCEILKFSEICCLENFQNL